MRVVLRTSSNSDPVFKGVVGVVAIVIKFPYLKLYKSKRETKVTQKRRN